MAPVPPQTPAAPATPPQPQPASAAAPPAAKPRRRWAFRLLLLLTACLGAGVWFAPLIVASTSLKQQIPKLIFPTYPGAMEVGEASLDWLRPVVVQDLKAEDAEGHPFLEVKQFSTSLPLWKLVIQRSSLGGLLLSEPRVSIEFRPGGSNVEDILEKFLSGPPSANPADFDLEIKDATIVLDHKMASQAALIKPVSLVLQSRRGRVEELELTIGQVPAPDEASLEPPTDWLAFRFGSLPTQEGVAMTPGSKHIRLKADAWGLEKLLPLLARIEPNVELAGTLDADVRSQIDLTGDHEDWTSREWSWDGRMTVKKFVLAGLSALKRDRVVLETTSLAGRLAAQQGRLAMDRAQLQTEIGELTATGDIPLAGFRSTSPVDTLRTILGEQDYTIHGHLDLQRLATLLPNTLRIREGTEITGGTLELNLKSAAQDADRRNWAADVVFDHLAARNQGQVVTWNAPLQINMQAHKAAGIVTVDRVACQSDFFKLTGQGTMTDARFTASGDLTQLEENLQRFVDLGVAKLAGQIKAQGEIRRLEDERISLQTAIQLDGFQWDLSKQSVWQEARLVLTVNAEASTVGDSSLKQIESAQLKLTSGKDSLVSNLQQPVDLTSSNPWSVKATLAGDLQTWQNRLRPFVDVAGWQLAGTVNCETNLAASSKQLELVSLTGNATNLNLRGPEWLIIEPQVKLETKGTWTTSTREWSSPETTVTGTSLACRVDDLVVGLKPNGALERITGEASFRGNLDKLSRWKNQALPRPYYHLMGGVEGHLHLIEKDSVITVDFDTTMTKLVVADLETMPNQELHWVALWREPQLQIIGKGSYDIAQDQLQMETATVQADGLSVNVHGSLAQLASAQRVDLKGELSYDWDLVSQRMGDSLRKAVQLRGKQARPISLHGSLASLATPANGQPAVVDLAGEAAVGWDSAQVQGLPVGPADLSAHVEGGVCQFAPIDTTVANGRLHLTPQIRLDRKPALLMLPTEKVIDRVQISPELCNSWLKFLAPLLADATQIDGQFSLDVTGAALPLTSPMTGEAGGALGVHQVQVRPGSSAFQVLGLIDQIQAIIERKPVGNAPRDRVWMQMPEQSIPFKLAGGRVFHQNATFVIGDGMVQTSGSVGIDESVDLVIVIPIRDEWAKDQKLLSGLKGKSLKIPVRGSLSRPQFDTRVLGELAAQIGGTALEGLLDQKVDDLFKKKLNKFLPGQN